MNVLEFLNELTIYGESLYDIITIFILKKDHIIIIKI